MHDQRSGLVATLTAPVIVELGAQSRLVIPLIAVHPFVLYYGIMGDVTPPRGSRFSRPPPSPAKIPSPPASRARYTSRTAVLSQATSSLQC